MSKAIYQPELERHYTLDMSHYCHFTSPIRRYPDLLVHRTINKWLAGQTAGTPMPTLQRLGHHCSDMEQNAEAAERELIRIKLLHFCSKKIGESLRGVISVVRYEGVVVRGIEIPVDGFVPVTSLPRDRYRYENHAHMLEGFKSGNRFRLGDEVVARIEKVDIARRQLIFKLEGVTKSATLPRAPKGKSDDSAGSGKRDRSNSKRAKRKQKLKSRKSKR
jgi:ribonuclease R